MSFQSRTVLIFVASALAPELLNRLETTVRKSSPYQIVHNETDFDKALHRPHSLVMILSKGDEDTLLLAVSKAKNTECGVMWVYREKDPVKAVDGLKDTLTMSYRDFMDSAHEIIHRYL